MEANNKSAYDDHLIAVRHRTEAHQPSSQDAEKRVDQHTAFPLKMNKITNTIQPLPLSFSKYNVNFVIGIMSFSM